MPIRPKIIAAKKLRSGWTRKELDIQRVDEQFYPPISLIQEEVAY
jgi:hypothetical protein